MIENPTRVRQSLRASIVLLLFVTGLGCGDHLSDGSYAGDPTAVVNGKIVGLDGKAGRSMHLALLWLVPGSSCTDVVVDRWNLWGGSRCVETNVDAVVVSQYVQESSSSYFTSMYELPLVDPPPDEMLWNIEGPCDEDVRNVLLSEYTDHTMEDAWDLRTELELVDALELEPTQLDEERHRLTRLDALGKYPRNARQRYAIARCASVARHLLTDARYGAALKDGLGGRAGVARIAVFDDDFGTSDPVRDHLDNAYAGELVGVSATNTILFWAPNEALQRATAARETKGMPQFDFDIENPDGLEVGYNVAHARCYAGSDGYRWRLIDEGGWVPIVPASEAPPIESCLWTDD